MAKEVVTDFPLSSCLHGVSRFCLLLCKLSCSSWSPPPSSNQHTKMPDPPWRNSLYGTALPPVKAALSPYAISLAADGQRAKEEERVRLKMVERQRKKDSQAREALRKQVVQLALEEARQLEKPRELAAALEQQKRHLASIGSMHADERHGEMRRQLYRRFYEPTPFEVEEREENWQRRRLEHRLQRGARLAQIQAAENTRSSWLQTQSQARLDGARHRYSERLQAISLGAMGNSASAPALHR